MKGGAQGVSVGETPALWSLPFFKDKGLNLIITRATPGDAQKILDPQKLAYQSEAASYQAYIIPPLRQTLPEMEAEIQNQVFLKAIAGRQIIGSMMAYLREGTCCIGRLIVRPDF